MATTTTKLALIKPAGTDSVDISVLNANSDKIDTAAGAFICTSATRPSLPYNGQIILETDTLNQRIWLASSSTWVQFSGIPVGSVTTFSGSTAPAGWLMCDGTAYSNTAYPDLQAIVGNTYGGTAGSTFAVPDMRGRVPVGKAASGTFNALNNNGGAETHTLTSGQMPSHSHDIYAEWGASGEAPFNVIYNSNMQLAGVSAGTRSQKGSIVIPSGGNEAHNNLQPYRVLNYIIKF